MLPGALFVMMKLLVVVGFQNQGEVTVIRFQGGPTAELSRQAKQYDYYLKLAQRSLERKHPVGVKLGANGEISEMARADNDFAAQFVDYDKEKVKVVFQGHDGTYFLRRDHPEFARIAALLNTSIQQDKRVWFVAEPVVLVIDDVSLAAEEPAKN